MPSRTLRDYAEVLEGLQAGLQRFVRDGISGVNRDLDSTDTEALVLVAYELNAHFGAEPLHDDTAPLEAENQARREAVSDGRSEDSHRIGRGIVSERCGLVCRLEERGEFAFADVRGTAVLLLSPRMHRRSPCRSGRSSPNTLPNAS